MSDPTWGVFCPECGHGVRIEEDGCCATCGRDAYPIPRATAEMLARNVELESDLAAVAPVVRAAVKMTTAADAVIHAVKQPDMMCVNRYAHASAEVARLVCALTPEQRARLAET